MHQASIKAEPAFQSSQPEWGWGAKQALKQDHRDLQGHMATLFRATPELLKQEAGPEGHLGPSSPPQRASVP